MKILTCNTHSLMEKDYETKLQQFVDVVAKERFDIIALQEVNQTLAENRANESRMEGFVEADTNRVTIDNHALRAVSMLKEQGIFYYWTWTPIKLGFERYDEGIAILSLKKPEETTCFYISNSDDYYDWHARKVIGIKIGGIWYYSVHMGWWQEETENFCAQWQKFLANTPKNGKIYLMGDFNNPAYVKEEGYDLVTGSGFYDTYHLAGQRDDGITVVKVIDGWHERNAADKMRIDFIFKNDDTPIASSKVFFNGDNGPVISDHFGVGIEE